MKYYPVGLNLEGKIVLVVGAGLVAEGKIKKLLEFKAKVKVVALQATANIIKLAKNGKLTMFNKAYNFLDLKGVSLVIAATSDRKINKKIHDDAKKRNIWVNVVDDTSLCEFTCPAVIRKKNLVLAISTDGKNPKLSKQFRAFLEGKVDEFNSNWN